MSIVKFYDDDEYDDYDSSYVFSDDSDCSDDAGITSESELEQEEDIDHVQYLTNVINSTNVKNIVDDLVSDVMIKVVDKEEERQRENYEKRWVANLDMDTVDKYKDEVRNIRKANQEKIPTLLRIVKSNMPFNDKCNAVEKLEIYENLQDYTSTKLAWKHQLNELIERYNDSQPDEDFDKQEKYLRNYFHSKVPIKYQALRKKGLHDKDKALLIERCHKLEQSSTDSSDYSKLYEWIQWALCIPTEAKPIVTSSTNLEHFLHNVHLNLDRYVYGLNDVKERIMCIVAKKITNPEATDLSLGLVGPKGTGKTSIVRAISKALNLPFEQISLGGCSDASLLEGHDYTYVGAQPGLIVKSLKKMKCNNGILFFDEFDKLCKTEHGKEVSWSLLHITDATQNNDFRDKYIGEISIDLSKLWFVYSMNTIDNVDPILLDRLNVIHIPDYNMNDKVRIGLDYMLPEIVRSVGLTRDDIWMGQDSMRYLVGKSQEHGVRQLKRNIGNIIGRINLLRLRRQQPETAEEPQRKKRKLNNNCDLPIEITKDIIDKLYVEPKTTSIAPSHLYI